MTLNISLFELLFGEYPTLESNTFGSILLLIHTVLLTIVAVVYFHQFLITLISIFLRKKRYPEAKTEHKFVILTSARNEERTIAQFINAINNLNYDKSRLEIHVIADNCSDETANIARHLGAKVYERNDLTKVGKSYALSTYFTSILAEKRTDIAGFIILDTDNIVDADFVKEINKVFDATAANVITSYRGSTNYNKSLWAFGTGYAFLRECSLLHKGRECIGISSYVSGTGFFVSYQKIVEQNGWHYFTFIEDIEFSAAQAIQKERIYYAHDAKFYDEQPIRLKYSWRQRMRWVKGLYQVNRKYRKQLFKAMFRRDFTFKERFTAFESLVFVTPLPTMIVIWYIVFALLSLLNLAFGMTPNYLFLTYGLSIIDFALGFYVFTTLTSIVISIVNWKRIKMHPILKILLPFVGFFYMITYVPILIIAMFAKVTWKEIPHYGLDHK